MPISSGFGDVSKMSFVGKEKKGDHCSTSGNQVLRLSPPICCMNLIIYSVAGTIEELLEMKTIWSVKDNWLRSSWMQCRMLPEYNVPDPHRNTGHLWGPKLCSMPSNKD